MQLTALQLVTIIAEDSLRSILEEMIIEAGAKGYTVCGVEGRGHTGIRDSAWSGENVRIETVVSDSIAEKIMKEVQTKYFDHYSVIVYVQAVGVLRSDHFM